MSLSRAKDVDATRLAGFVPRVEPHLRASRAPHVGAQAVIPDSIRATSQHQAR